MSDSSELLALRLGLLAILLLFLLLTAITMRGALRPTALRAMAPSRAGAAMARMVVLVPAGSGLRPGDEFAIAGEMTIGRDAANGIVIADSSVSSRHARILASGKGWRVVDLGSTNGTFVNSAAIDGRGAALRPGDTVELGSVVFRFEG